MDPLLAKLEAIEAKLDRVLFPEVIDLRGVMHLTGCRSTTAQNRFNHKYGLKPYAHNKYRRKEVSNLVAHLRLVAPTKVKRAPAASIV